MHSTSEHQATPEILKRFTMTATNSSGLGKTCFFLSIGKNSLSYLSLLASINLVESVPECSYLGAWMFLLSETVDIKIPPLSPAPDACSFAPYKTTEYDKSCGEYDVQNIAVSLFRRLYSIITTTHINSTKSPTLSQLPHHSLQNLQGKP